MASKLKKHHDIKFRIGNDTCLYGGKSEPSGVQVANSYPRRGAMRVSIELLPWVFVLLRHSEIKLHCLDSPERTLQDDTIFICYYVKWGHLTRHLGFNYILKSKEITEINAKSNQNAYEMYIFANCCNEMKKTEKKTEKPVDFWRNLYEILTSHGNVKNERHTVDISILPQRMNELTATEIFSPLEYIVFKNLGVMF